MPTSISSSADDTFTDSGIIDEGFQNNKVNTHNNEEANQSLSQNDSSLDIQQLLLNFQENEPIFDNELLYPTPKESEIVHFKDGKLIRGTVEALITYVTSPEILNYQFLVDFFLTFRTYIDSLPLLELLLCRLSWCLKNSLSTDLERSSVGRLVLVRTFVAIRHWLLNHFQDDFVINPLLRQLFTNTVNELSKYEQYIGTDPNSLQSKIIKDLKKNYLTLCSVYWNLDISNLPENLLNYQIHSYNNIKNSRLSTMGLNQLNDPSARRSTLLYTLDSQSSSNALNDLNNNKAGTNENPLEYFISNNPLLKTKSKTLSSKDENKLLYPKASLNALDVKRNNSQMLTNDASSIDQLYSTLYSFNNEPISGFVSLDQHNLTINKNDGFTTRGNIEIFKDSKVTQIQSLTKEIPNKKIADKSVQPKTPVQIKTFNKNTTVKTTGMATNKPTLVDLKPIKPKPKRKGFLKSIFNHHDHHNKENSHPTSMTSTQAKQNQSTSIKKEPLATINKNTDRIQHQTSKNLAATSPSTNPKKSTSTYLVIANLERNMTISDSNLDYLEDLVIKDYQLLMQLPHFRQRYSKQLKNGNRKSVLSTALDLTNHDFNFVNQQPIGKSSTDELVEKRSLNENDSKGDNNIIGENAETSFQSPANDIDWSESIDVDNSNNNDFIDMGITTQDIQDVSLLENTSNLNRSNIHNNREIFKRDRSSLQLFRSSINNSQIHKRNKCNSDSNILENLSNSNRYVNISSNVKEDNESVATSHNSFSVNIIGRSSMISNKSYMTYDSDFSASSKVGLSLNKENETNKLRKKNAISNLRVDNLSELDDEVEEMETNTKDSNLNNGNIKSEKQSISSMATANVLDMNNLLELQELPFYNYISIGNGRNSDISILPSPTPSQTCYNGLSQTDINELAAIPDEKLDGDPLHYTLSKLRGERSRPKVIIGLNDDDDYDDADDVDDYDDDGDIDEEEIHRKHAVAIVCESPTDERFAIPTIVGTLKNEYNNSDYDSNDEIKLEKQVRDLYISNNNKSSFEGSNDESEPHDVDTAATENDSIKEGGKLEMNMISTQSLGNKRYTGTNLTRVSTGKLLKDDGERSCFEMHSLVATPKGVNCSPILTITEILQNELHIPFIFKYDSDKLASQMTLIERDIIMEVEWKDLINLKWDQPLSPYNSWLRLLLDLTDKTGLQMITLRFNLVNNWIISEILLCKNFTLRVLAITRFIQLAYKCRKIQNYATLFQIMLALNSEVMKQLRSTWIRVDPGTILKFKELKDLTSPNNNFKKYREELEKVIPSKGFIPFLPLELSDLTTYSEMPTIVSSKPDSETDDLVSVDQDNFGEELDSSYDLINFEKFTVTGETVKRTLRFIEWSRFYDFKTDDEVISKCLYISSLSEEDMELCLKEIEAVSV